MYPDFGAGVRERGHLGTRSLGLIPFASDWSGGREVQRKEHWVRALDPCVLVATLPLGSCVTLGSHLSLVGLKFSAAK